MPQNPQVLFYTLEEPSIEDQDERESENYRCISKYPDKFRINILEKFRETYKLERGYPLFVIYYHYNGIISCGSSYCDNVLFFNNTPEVVERLVLIKNPGDVQHMAKLLFCNECQIRCTYLMFTSYFEINTGMESTDIRAHTRGRSVTFEEIKSLVQHY